MPASPAIRVVLDPGDTKGCAELVGGLHCLAAGRVVCHATHTGRGAGGLGLELLVGLGKRFDAARVERVHGRGWELAEIWTAAERTRDLFILRAHLLGSLGHRNGTDLSDWRVAVGHRCGSSCTSPKWAIGTPPSSRDSPTASS